MNQSTEIVHGIHELVRSEESMKESLDGLIQDLKFHFDCEAVTVFGVDQSKRQLYSINNISNTVSEIRVDISLNTLAGYVAGTGSSLNIANVKDHAELGQYHPQLAHGEKWEEILEFTSNSMIVVPIPYNRSLIGILEVINKKSDAAFSAQDMKMAQEIAPALGLVLVRFYNDNLRANPQEPETPSETISDSTVERHETTQEDDDRAHQEKESNPAFQEDEDTEHHQEFDLDIPETEDTSHQDNPDLAVQEDQDTTYQEEPDLTVQEDQDTTYQEEPDLTVQEDQDSTYQEEKDLAVKANQDLDRRNSDRRESGRRDSDKENEIRKISQAIHDEQNFEEVLVQFKDTILENFDAEDMTLYGLDSTNNEIYSTFQTREKTREVRLPLANSNIPGYVAIAQKSINILDVENPQELLAYHDELTFNDSENEFSDHKTSELLALPLMYEQNLLGVLKIVNKKNGGSFTQNDETRAAIMADNLAYALSKKKKKDELVPTKYSYLIENELITEEVLESSIAYAKSNHVDVETVLIDRVGLTRKSLGLSLENCYNLPYYGYEKSITLPKKILGGLNKNFLAKNFWLPIYSDNSKVIILINDPSNPDKIQNIKHIFPKKEIEFNVGLKIDLIDFLNSVMEQDGAILEPVKSEEMSSLINTLHEENEDARLVDSDDDIDDTGQIKEGDNAIIRLVNKVLIDAYDRGASDIHIEPGMDKDNIMIRFRKDGECGVYEEIPFLYKHAIISRIKIMSQLDIAERRQPQDGKFKMRYGANEIEFRVATCPTVGGNEDIVLRILAKNENLPLGKMNFSEKNIDLINRSLAKPYGLVLVVGPTGSGKTTTLHSCLGAINTPKKKIWTVEDPVEITQKGIRQVQTNEKKGLNFARAMRSFLRGDPDVIMVGEMRDTETASIGLEASLTGHLVFSTLHTNSAPETVTRLLDMGMNPLNFADSLLLVVAQRLVKTLCKKCREDYHPTQEEFDIIVQEYGEKHFPRLGITYDNDLTLKKANGCKDCDDTGYAGRTAIHELLEGTSEAKRLVVKQASAEELRKRAIEDGMSTLKQDGIEKVFKGDCDLKQVLAVCII